MQARMQTRLVLDALMMAIWRRKPKNSLIIHSDQGIKFGSDEFIRWCKDYRLRPSMSRRSNSWDNAVAKSFFSCLKSELIKKKIYPSRSAAKSEIFEYIDEFYDRRKSLWDNRVRRHKHLAQLSQWRSNNVILRYEQCLRYWGNAKLYIENIKIIE